MQHFCKCILFAISVKNSVTSLFSVCYPHTCLKSGVRAFSFNSFTIKLKGTEVLLMQCSQRMHVFSFCCMTKRKLPQLECSWLCSKMYLIFTLWEKNRKRTEFREELFLLNEIFILHVVIRQKITVIYMYIKWCLKAEPLNFTRSPEINQLLMPLEILSQCTKQSFVLLYHKF